MTDYYTLAENALIELLRTLTIFANDWQVSQGDDSVLSRGAEYLAIVRPSTIGEFEDVDNDMKSVTWGAELYLNLRYKNEKETSALFRAFRSDVFNLLISNPTLGNIAWVQNVAFSAGSGVWYIKINDMPNTPPAFMTQQIDLQITQLIPLTEGEYGN